MSDIETHPNSAVALGATASSRAELFAHTLGKLRRGLTLGGLALVRLILLLSMTGITARLGGAVGLTLWGIVGASFLGALAMGMMESAARRDAAAAAKTPEEARADRREGVDEPEPPPVIRRGNPLRWARGGGTTAFGAVGAFLLMAHNGQIWIAGVPLGAVFCAIASWGVMDLLGTFDDAEERVVTTTTFEAIVRPLVRTVLLFVAFCLTLAGASNGVVLPQFLWGVLVTAAFVALVVSVYDLGVKLGPWAKDEEGKARSLLRRHGFWLIVAAALLYLPFMGSFSLWDPWETHYGEVSREILARDDWISLWWAQDGWFWSKPILDFWIQAIAMATLGVHYKPDQMLVGSGQVPHMHPEWVVRAPVVLMTILAMYLLYKGVSRTFGRRAGFLGGLVLATMPDWFFLAHQTMTDMPFVAAMTASMGLIMLGLRAPEETNVRTYEIGVGKASFRLSAWHLVFGAILVCAIPQILYLLSRNLELVVHGSGAKGFRFHWDEFRSGSGGGNCGLPGNEACNHAVSASIPKDVGANPTDAVGMFKRTFFAVEPFVQAIVWSVVLGFVLYMNWGERRIRRMYYLAAWFFAAVSTMGKGPAGFGLPMLCTFMYVCTTRRWKELARFEIWSGLLLIGCVALPWYVAMYVRHGSPFTDRLIFHDMFNRAFHHVHDTNEGDDTSFRFYVWQLGYALFPWTGLAPLGLVWWLRRGDAADRGKGDTSVLLVMWFVFAFALFSFMGTKFHHYIFPAVPPVAMLIGIVLDEMIGEVPLAARGSLPLYLGGLTGGAVISILGATRLLPGAFLGGKEGGVVSAASPGLAIVLMIIGAAVMVGTVLFFRGRPDPAAATRDGAAESMSDGDAAIDRRHRHESLMIAGSVVAGALLLALVGRDLLSTGETPDQPGAIRLLQLFTYNYRRPWPDSLDFRAVLGAFLLVAMVLSIAMAWHKARRHAVAAFLAFAFVWGLWGLDVYMVKTAPHWGQHELIEAYYANRANKDEQLVAYQMNWKGENFYTGNHVPAFVSTGATFTSWLKKQRDAGVKVMYFVTEHSRVGGLKSEVAAKSYKELTTKELCNKFVLVRAEL